MAGARDLGTFVGLPWRIQGGDPNWIPPLRSQVKRSLDPSRDPFFRHGAATLYLAFRGKTAVGRIAAIENRLHHEVHGGRVGFFGYFEAEDDPEVVGGLLHRAAEDLRARGLTEMRGPVSPSINGECGFLVEGFHEPPSLFMPYNPPYYPRRVEEAGLRPLMDLHAYTVSREDAERRPGILGNLDRIGRAVARRRPDLEIRTLDVRRFEEETAALNDLFNRAREGNFGFVPVTDEEFAALREAMRPFLDPELVVFARDGDRLVSCLLALPDVGPILRRMNGRLLPFGWWHVLRGRRRLRRIRVFGGATLPAYRRTGITGALIDRLAKNALRRGYEGAEISWVAADNERSIRTIEHALRAKPAKRYRLFTSAPAKEPCGGGSDL